MSNRIHTVDQNLRRKIIAFQSSRDKASMLNRKDNTSAVTRDLNELLGTNPTVKSKDFPSTTNLVTMVAVVPKDKVRQWLDTYESLNDFIVPRSTKEFEVEADIGAYRLFRVILLRRVQDDVVEAAKAQMNVTLRNYEYDVAFIAQREEDKKRIQDDSTKNIEELTKTCTKSFTDLYSTYAHIKMLKVAIDS